MIYLTSNTEKDILAIKWGEPDVGEFERKSEAGV